MLISLIVITMLLMLLNAWLFKGTEVFKGGKTGVPAEKAPQTCLALLGFLLASMSLGFVLARTWGAPLDLALILGPLCGFMAGLLLQRWVIDAFEGFPNSRKIFKKVIWVEIISYLCFALLIGTPVTILSLRDRRMTLGAFIALSTSAMALLLILSAVNGRLLGGSYFFWKNLLEAASNPKVL